MRLLQIRVETPEAVHDAVSKLITGFKSTWIEVAGETLLTWNTPLDQVIKDSRRVFIDNRHIVKDNPVPHLFFTLTGVYLIGGTYRPARLRNLGVDCTKVEPENINYYGVMVAGLAHRIIKHQKQLCRQILDPTSKLHLCTGATGSYSYRSIAITNPAQAGRTYYKAEYTGAPITYLCDSHMYENVLLAGTPPPTFK